MRHAGFAEDVLLAEIVAVIGAQNHRGIVPQLLLVDDVEQATEPVIDHRQLGAVVGADVIAPRAAK